MLVDIHTTKLHVSEESARAYKIIAKCRPMCKYHRVIILVTSIRLLESILAHSNMNYDKEMLKRKQSKIDSNNITI